MADYFNTILKQTGWRALLKGLLVISAFIVLGYALKDVDFEESFRALPFSNAPNAPWYKGPVGYVLLGAVAISVSCPRQVVSFFAAYFFGLPTGFVVALLATVFACVLTYSFARIFQNRVSRFVRGKLDIAVTFWKENTFLTTMVWRFMPAGSNLLTNLAAGAIALFVISALMGLFLYARYRRKIRSENQSSSD